MKVNNKEVAYVGTVHGVGLVCEGERGYRLISEGGSSYDANCETAKRMNLDKGINQTIADELEVGSMFGFHVPGAGRFQHTNTTPLRITKHAKKDGVTCFELKF